MLTADLRQDRLEEIRKLMAKQGLSGHPSRYVVLYHWSVVADADRDYHLEIPLPNPLKGARLWAVVGDNELFEVRLIEERGSELWVERVDHPVQFLASRDSIRALPLPFKPLVVPRHRLHRWVGALAAARIGLLRRRALGQA